LFELRDMGEAIEIKGKFLFVGRKLNEDWLRKHLFKCTINK
jgi:hypothetical protein